MKFLFATIAQAARAHAEGMSPFRSKALTTIVAVLVGIGILARLSPLIDPDGRLFWQYMTEDGYLMQSIARNIAMGWGMTTAAGTIATNGVQPLATFLFAALHFLAGDSKTGGIALLTIFSTIVSALAAYFFYRLSMIVFVGLRHGKEFAIATAVLWFAAPLIVPISMNGLETGVYFLAIMGTFFYYLSALSTSNVAFGWRERITLGVLLGAMFLSRNDAVFFIAALLSAHLLVGGVSVGGGYGHRFIDCIVSGGISVFIAAPWLIYNYSVFGSIIPVSGIAESHTATLGNNLPLIPVKLFEASVLYLPLPGRFEQSTAVLIVSLGALIVCLLAFWSLVARHMLPARRFFIINVGATVALGGYYGLFFGAPWFLARYFSVLSPFLWLATAATVFHTAMLLLNSRQRIMRAATAFMILLTAISAAFAGVSFAHGKTHMHKQVVDWVKTNVPDTTWVGAVQTGTLGYFHDRTVNLDGKVNPYALRVLLDKGHILDYVVDSQINYIVDWAPMADWVKLVNLSPAFAEQFQVVVKDEDHNLAVLKRIYPKAD